jgi:hypothetical protein
MSNWRDERPATTKHSKTKRAELAMLRARYDDGAVSPAVYSAIKKLEADIAWCEHTAAAKRVAA